MSFLCPLGALLMYGFVSAGAGLGEGVWTADSPGLWVAVAVGGVGLALSIAGWRAVLRPPRLPGQCRKCGYQRAGLAVCPECGARAGELAVEDRRS